MKTNDKVKIISAPIVENNVYGQVRINHTIGKTGQIMHVYKNGIRNIAVSTDDHEYNYYASENLELI